jgi:integrase
MNANHPTVVVATRKTGRLSAIVIRIILRRRVVKTINTGLRIDPAAWDVEARRVNRREPSAALYNAKIQAEVARLQAEFARQEILGVSITGSRARRIAEGGTPGADFYAFARGWIPKKYLNAESRRTMMAEVGKMERFRPALEFGDIGFEFLTEYRGWMEALGNAPNTVWKSLRILNTLLNDATRVGGIIESNPLAGHDRGKYKNPERFGVELSDCDRLEELIAGQTEMPPQVRFAAVRFLLMAYSGLRFADAMAFNPAVHIRGDRIEIRTQKKGVLLEMKVHRRLAGIIPQIEVGRKMSNQELNRWLKVAGAMAGISTRLTCHVGRHTFGALLADLDIPIEVAQRLMAHSDSRSTRIYFHIKKTALDRAVDKIDRL